MRYFAELKEKIQSYQAELKSILLRSAVNHIQEDKGTLPFHMILLLSIISLGNSRNVPQKLIWWDIENQSLPKGSNLMDLKNYILCSLKSRGILHLDDDLPEIKVYGNYKQLTRIIDQLTEEFDYHPTKIEKNSADNAIMKSMLEWDIQLRCNLWRRLREVVNYQETCVVLISSDKDFGPMLDYMKSEGHKIIIMCPDTRREKALREKADTHISWYGGNTVKV